MNIKNLFWKFFPIIKPIVHLIPQKARYGGKDYMKTLNFINETEYLSDEKRYNLQVKLLKDLLVHAYETVPYWKRLFDKIDFSPYKLSEIYHIEKIPLMTKKVLKENFDSLKSRNFNSANSHYEYSGGTTGTPVAILVDNKSLAKEWAFMHNQWFRVGYKITDKKLTLRGHKSFNNRIIFNPWYNEFIVSPYDSSSFEDVYEKVNKEEISVIHGYPSRIYKFAVYLNNRNLVLEEINLVLCGSESLFNWQKQMMKKAFPQAQIYSWYGHTEKLVLGGNCELNFTDYHLFYQYGLTEILKENNKTDFEGEGEIIGTGFINYAMPLIRYRTGDIGCIRKTKCECDRNYDLLRITSGRAYEYVVDKYGKKLSLTSLIFATHSNELAKLTNFQLQQKKAGEVILKYVSSIRINERLLAEEIQKKCNGLISITPKKVKSINRTNRGKHRYIVQELK